MVCGREFQRAVIEGTKEDCMDFVQENGIVMFDGWMVMVRCE